MLATLVAAPFHKPGWVYEEKYDGDRILAYKEEGRVRLLSRNDIDRTAGFPRIAAAIQALSPKTLLLDGEVVIFDKHQVSRFQLLQQSKGEPVYAVFDCLYCDGKDLRREPLSIRRSILQRVLKAKSTVLMLSRGLAENGLEAYKMASQRGYEGLVAKDLSSPYIEKRSDKWLKVKVHQEDEFVIGGFTAPHGSRKYFGALLLGAYKDGKVHYVGKVGTGFDQERLRSLFDKFKPMIRKNSPFAEPPRAKGSDIPGAAPRRADFLSGMGPATKNCVSLFLGLRTDKDAREVTLPEAKQ